MSNLAPAPEPYILFDLAGTTYGLPSRVVHQIEMVEHVTPVPAAPPFVAGIVFLRGQVVPAIDLRARFGLPSLPYSLQTRLVVVGTGNRTVGWIVDSAREFRAIPHDAMKRAPETIASPDGKLLEAVVTLGDRIILILNPGVVSDPALEPATDASWELTRLEGTAVSPGDQQ